MADSRVQVGKMKTKPEYAEPILRVLEKKGVTISIDSLLEAVYQYMKHELTSTDHELLYNGAVPRWRNQAQNMLDGLVEEGYIVRSGDQVTATELARKYLKDI
jgi:hypothetical protein